MVRSSTPILMYHRVTPDDLSSYSRNGEMLDSLIVRPDAFARQMAWLSRLGFRTLSLTDLLDARMNRRSVPRRSVVITFDDGYQDFVDFAAPVLMKHGFTAHIFLVAGLVGGSSGWDRENYGWSFPLLTWEAARILQFQGFHCDAHSMTHPPLADLSETDARREIEDSRAVLEQELGRSVQHFAYPFGSYSDEIRAMVRDAGFRSACSVQRGLSRVDDDPYAMRRIWVNQSDSLIDFVSVVLTGRKVSRGVASRLDRLRTSSH